MPVTSWQMLSNPDLDQNAIRWVPSIPDVMPVAELVFVNYRLYHFQLNSVSWIWVRLTSQYVWDGINNVLRFDSRPVEWIIQWSRRWVKQWLYLRIKLRSKRLHSTSSILGFYVICSYVPESKLLRQSHTMLYPQTGWLFNTRSIAQNQKGFL